MMSHVRFCFSFDQGLITSTAMTWVVNNRFRRVRVAYCVQIPLNPSVFLAFFWRLIFFLVAVELSFSWVRRSILMSLGQHQHLRFLNYRAFETDYPLMVAANYSSNWSWFSPTVLQLIDANYPLLPPIFPSLKIESSLDSFVLNHLGSVQSWNKHTAIPLSPIYLASVF